MCRALLVLFLASLSTAIHAQDRVILQPDGTSGTVSLRGEIIDYTGRELVIRPRELGDIKRYPASTVREIQTAYHDSHLAGREALARRDWATCEDKLATALNQETRTWVRRDILALQVRSALEQGKWLQAARRFLLIVESDPRTIHYDLIPLLWIGETLNDEESALMRGWLNHRYAAAQLIAVSALLDVRDAQVTQTLKSLLRGDDIIVQRLARFLDYRAQISDDPQTLPDIRRWENQADELAPALRGGPYVVIGVAYSLKHEHDWAAACYLRTPLMNHPDARLRRAAGRLAVESLTAAGMIAAAESLQRELSNREME